jgi:DNA polymerase-3 subunit delta
VPPARSRPRSAAEEELVPLTLVTGDEELLVSRAVSRVVAAARQTDPEADIRDLAPADVNLGALLDLLSPSLFGSLRVVVLRDAGSLAREVTDALGEYVRDPLPEVVLVVQHSGAKGKAFADAVRAAGSRVVECPKVRWPEERIRFLQQEVRAAGRSATPEALKALVDTVGPDLRELSTALAQLLSDVPDTLDEDAVLSAHRSLAAENGFVVADRVLAGDAAGALALVRSALVTGFVDPRSPVKPEGVPVVTVSTLAGAVRDIALVMEAPPGRPDEVARRLGIPPFRVRRAMEHARGWQPEGLRTAGAALARADGEVKGGAADQAYALERAVLAVVTARGQGAPAPRPQPSRATARGPAGPRPSAR